MNLEQVNGGFPIRPIEFTQVTDYTTFRAEYAVEGDDIILHFFRSPEKQKEQEYWLRIFPKVLDQVARSYFQASAPKLRAAYTDEMDSWWMRANGYLNILDKKTFVLGFLQELDQALDKVISA